MRKFRLLFILLAIVSAAMFASCTENNQVVDTTTTVVFGDLENNFVEIDSEGGEVNVNYMINNGIEGLDIVASTEAEWISDIVVCEGTLAFTVAKNMETQDHRPHHPRG